MKKPRNVLVFAAILLSGFMLITAQADFGFCVIPSPTYYVTIEKTVDQNTLTLSVGQSIVLNYEIVVTVSDTEPAPGICYFPLYPGEAIVVNDSAIGYLPDFKIYYSDGPGEYKHQYQYTVGPYDFCGEYVINNEACLEYNPLPPPDDCCAAVAVMVSVPCDDGCTLTPGYWKTHSEYGPAPYDDTWAMLTDGADTPFFGTGQTYYQVLWTEPRGGNAYYILAHAYIAAELNVLNGASIPSMILEAWNQAGELLDTYDGTAPSIPKRTSDRNLAIELAQMLDAYNNGYVGPGHCSE